MAANGKPKAAFFLRIALLLFNAFVWGVSWWPLRELNALGLHGLWATGLVFCLATLLISAGRPAAWGALLADRRLLWLVLASGAANIAFTWGVMIGEVVRVVLLFYLMPVWAAPIARWLLGEAITPLAMLRIVLAVSGAIIVLYQPGMGWPLPSGLADCLGLVGGIAFAAVNVLLRYSAGARDDARLLSLFVGSGMMALGLAALMTAIGAVAPPPALATPWLAGALGLALALLAGNLALQYAAARLPSSVTVLVMLSEVPFAAISSVLIAGEALGARTLLGGAMIVAAAALAALGVRRAQPASSSSSEMS